MTKSQEEELVSASMQATPGETIKIPDGVSTKEASKLLSTLDHLRDPTLKTFTITSTIKLKATDARGAILKASQLLADLTNSTPYEFEVFNVKVE